MNRARLSFAATLVAAVALGAGILAEQATQAPPAQAPPMQSVLAGRKLTPPARGDVTVEYTAPVRKRVGDTIVTTFQVKNINVAPIARLVITQTWFDKSNNVVGGGKGEIAGLFQPGDVKTIKIEAEAKPSFNGDGFNFTHANGTVKAKLVAKVAAPAGTATAGAKAPAAKAPAAKAPAKK
jgi:hypothetical protein